VKCGDLVTVAVSGDYRKPRPALAIQAGAFGEPGSVTVLRLTGALHNAPLVRVTMPPSPENSLRVVSQVVIDRALSVPRDKVGLAFGKLDDATMQTVTRALTFFLDLS
jgi:mRNA interferase MazF